VPGLEVKLAEKVILPLFERTSILARFILRVRNFFRSSMCPVFWRILKLNHMPDRLREELEEKEEFGLLSVLFGVDDSY
jgi:hypothetical protein